MPGALPRILATAGGLPVATADLNRQLFINDGSVDVLAGLLDIHLPSKLSVNSPQLFETQAD